MNWLGPYGGAEVGAAASRAAIRPAFLASALAEYMGDREWTPEKLADWLHCAPGQLAALGLCRRPDPATPQFSEQVTQIVVHFRLDYWNLRRLLEDMALPFGQRQLLWQSEAVHPRHGADVIFGDIQGFGGEFGQTTRAARPRMASMSQGMVRKREALEGDAAAEPLGPPIEAVPMAAPRQSWLARLLAAIRNLFSRKS
jgi:hypothetical protein